MHERTVNINFDLNGLTDDSVCAFITEIHSAFKDVLKAKIIGNKLWGREHGIEVKNWVIYSVDPLKVPSWT